jgi:hypothetical protein
MNIFKHPALAGRERNLDHEAKEFIVDWARELPVDQLIRIVARRPQHRERNVRLTITKC